MNNGSGLRVVLWLSGCDHKCKGCQNPQTWDVNSGIPFDEKAKEAWLSLGIKPTFWGQGIGTKVLKQFIQNSFLKHNLKTIRLSVFAKNRRALSLYLKLGFEIEWIYHKNQALYWLSDDIYQLYLNKKD